MTTFAMNELYREKIFQKTLIAVFLLHNYKLKYSGFYVPNKANNTSQKLKLSQAKDIMENKNEDFKKT